MVTHGAWIDHPTADVSKPAFWNGMVEHGFSTGAIMLEGLGNCFDPRYDTRELGVIRQLAHERDIELVLTTWPEPTVKYMKNFEASIHTLLKVSGAAGLEFDMEGNWLKNEVQGFANLDKAGDAFVQMFDRVTHDLDVRTECTTYPYHTENSKTADVAPSCDRVLPQAYSVRNRASGKIEWASEHGPGRIQNLTLGRALQIKGVGTNAGPLVSCGLAAYDQEWPKRVGEEAMRVAYDAALKYNPVEVRWWSTKWIFNHRLANGYASRFIKTLKK